MDLDLDELVLARFLGELEEWGFVLFLTCLLVSSCRSMTHRCNWQYQARIKACVQLGRVDLPDAGRVERGVVPGYALAGNLEMMSSRVACERAILAYGGKLARCRALDNFLA